MLGQVRQSWNTIPSTPYSPAISSMYRSLGSSDRVMKSSREARAIELVAEAKAAALRTIGEAAATEKGQKAVQLDLATSAIEAKRAIAKESTVVLMDEQSGEAGRVVAEAVAIVSAMNRSDAFSGGAADGGNRVG